MNKLDQVLMEIDRLEGIQNVSQSKGQKLSNVKRVRLDSLYEMKLILMQVEPGKLDSNGYKST